MFVVRSVLESDLDDLYELSNLITLINLPNDREILQEKIQASVKSFKTPSPDKEKNFYIFVLCDLAKNKVIGASMIHGKHGTPKEPHFFLKVGREHKLSTSLNTGFIHGTLKFGLETDGHTEIGGLILDLSYRGHPEKLGKVLSFARFHYIGQHLSEFTPTIHSELLPPFDVNGNSPLWEAIGRRFLNMDYHDADKLSRENKEFITSLYPVDTIYEALLPLEARNAIGKVGKQTEPVKRMLESIGFRYMEEVDPFDGGPHLRALSKEISLIKNLKEYKVKDIKDCLETETKKYLATVQKDNIPFYSFTVEAVINNNEMTIYNDKLGLKVGQKLKAFLIS